RGTGTCPQGSPPAASASRPAPPPTAAQRFLSLAARLRILGFAPLNPLSAKNLSRTIFRILHFLYRSQVYTYCVYTCSGIRESQKMHLTISPVMPAKKPSQNAFGQRLVTFRQARGLTQVQLAKATGMTQRAISYYEIEAEFPPAPALITLAQV